MPALLPPATGRRKVAVARVQIAPGGGKIVVNDRPIEEYFPRPSWRAHAVAAFETTGTTGRYDVTARVYGGGLTGQAGALRLGIARALVAANAEFRPALKRAGLLTRDARKVERKKYGRPGARKRFQHSKR